MALAATPLLELRGSIPYAMLLDPVFPAWKALWLSVLGSWLPAFLIMYILEHAEPLIRKNKKTAQVLDAIYRKTRAKSQQIKDLEFWGLVIFIGIPLPGTGVWTGVLAAYLLGLSKGQTIFAAFLGTSIAGVIMVFLSTYISAIIRFGLMAIIATVLAIMVYIWYSKRK